jgi:curved DNA-binding protein CbpA
VRTTRTYYEILGLPRSATLVQVKRRYKELVRKYHPDVAADKVMAHRLFLQIREAYETLTDPSRRKAYDASLDSEYASRSAASASGSARRSSPSSSGQLLKEAQWAFIQRRFGEAAQKCNEVIRNNPRSARAYSILGDAYRAQGKINGAIKAYSYAVQYDPSDRDSQRKLDKLISRKTAPPPAPSRSAGNASRITLFAIWWSVGFFLVMLINVYPGEPMPWLKEYIPAVSLWSLNMVVLMAAASCVVGMLLCMGGMLRHPDNELVFQNSDNWAMIPTGLVLLIGSGFWFVGSAGFYVAVGLLQGNLSRSVLAVFAGVAGVVLLTSVVYVPDARRQVLLFGGNVSFLSMLFGWYLGSMFRPLSES